MKKSIYLFITLLFLLKTVQGQNVAQVFKNQIEVGIGYQSNLIKDTNFSPLNQKGGGFATLVKYQRISKNILGANIQFSSGSIDSGTANEFSTSYINANVGFEYLFGLSEEKNTYHFYVGPAYNTKVLYLDWYNLDAYSYVATHGIAVKGLISRTIKTTHLIQASLSLPVFQFLARPPYNGIDEYIIENQDNPAKILFNSSPSSFNTFIALEFYVIYKYKLSKRIDWYLNYTLYTQKALEPSLFKSLSNTITTGIAINF